MKKIFALLTVMLLVALLCACGCEHEWEAADCNDPKTCSKCGETEGEELGHDYVDADCENPKTCSRCEKTRGEALGHTWGDATCDAPKTCQVCAKTEGEALGHTWTDATCEEPKTCSVCAATEGEPAGHSWLDATCTENAICANCGATGDVALGHDFLPVTCVDPHICSRCGATDGEPAGHSWVDATTEVPKTCSVCGATEGSPLPKPMKQGLGKDMATLHAAIETNMKLSGYTQTATYLGLSDDGVAVYEVFNADGTFADVYLMYTLCTDGKTVDTLVIYTDKGTDNTTSNLAGAYLGSAIVAVDKDNAATIYNAFMESGKVEANKAQYYTTYDGIGYLMMVEVAADGTAELTCAIGPVE